MLTYDWTAKILYPLLTRSSLWWSWRNLIALEYLIFNVSTQTFCQPGFMEIWQLCLTEMIIFFRKVKGHGLLLQTCIFSSDPFAFWMLSRWITSNNWERGVRLGQVILVSYVHISQNANLGRQSCNYFSESVSKIYLEPPISITDRQLHQSWSFEVNT